MTRSDVTTLNHPVAALDDLPDAVLVPRRQRDRGRFDDVGHRDPEQALVAGGQGGELLDRRGLGRQPHDVAVGVAHSGERIPEVSIHENDLSGGDAATIVLLSPAAPQGSLVGFDPGPATLMAGRDHERGLPITSTTIHADDARLITDWLSWLAAGNLSPNTVRNRKYLAFTFARCYSLADATSDDVAAHLAGLRSPSSRASHLAALRSLYGWAVKSRRLADDPTILIRSIRVPDKEMLPVPKVILDRALLLTDERTRFMLLLGSRAGLRREEIATLHSRCVGLDHLTIVGKGSKTRRVYIHPDLRPYLDRLVAEGGWAFPSHIYPGKHISPETVQRAVSAALGEPWTTHSLRRYAATSWYAASKDIRSVQAALGHSSPATTAKYVHADDDAMAAMILAA